MGHRPAGGGGGTFGTRGDVGARGGANAYGAVFNQQPPQGGAPGPDVFTDMDTTNDFFRCARRSVDRHRNDR